jgi:hypothetical protein
VATGEGKTLRVIASRCANEDRIFVSSFYRARNEVEGATYFRER